MQETLTPDEVGRRHETALAAGGVFVGALLLYIRTLLPGPSFGDWGEMQYLPSVFGVPHPTGYPLYMLLDKLFSLAPIRTPAYRADLLSAVAAAGAAATCVLISIRLGVRPVLAAIAGLTLAVTGTLWLEATFSEMNGLHLFLMALVIHRALVWHQDRRPLDLLLGALLAGLSVANHLLSVTVLPIVTLFVLADARRLLVKRPMLLVRAALLVVTGVSLYLIIPLRAMDGPPAVYKSLTTWDGVSSLVSGAMFRSDMHFGTVDSLGKVVSEMPRVVAVIQANAGLPFLVGGLVGGVLAFVRHRWAATMLLLVALVNVYFFANYRGDLDHYLLVTWLVLAVWLAIAAEAVAASIGWLADRFRIGTEGDARRLRARAAWAQALLLVLPLAIGSGNWATHDQSANRIGEDFAAGVFARLPPNAVLFTYWDALTTLSYVHCIEGRRPDLSLWAYDPEAKVTCDPVTGPIEDVIQARPVFALFPFDGDVDRLRDEFVLLPGPVLALPYGERVLDHTGVLYQVMPRAGARVVPTH